MAAVANIRIENAPSIINVHVSDDGSPEIMLGVLADFYQLPFAKRSLGAFKGLYLSALAKTRGDCVDIGIGTSKEATWDYRISPSGKLTTSCHAAWFKATHAKCSALSCSPFDYLMCVAGETKSRVRASISRAVSSLNTRGITMTA